MPAWRGSYRLLDPQKVCEISRQVFSPHSVFQLFGACGTEKFNQGVRMKLLIARSGLAAMLEVSPRHTNNIEKLPGFPKPIVLGPRCVRWRVEDVVKWLATVPPDEDRKEPPQLKRGRVNWHAQSTGEESGTAPAA